MRTQVYLEILSILVYSRSAFIREKRARACLLVNKRSHSPKICLLLFVVVLRENTELFIHFLAKHARFNLS